MNNIEVEDCTFSGPLFTWSNKQLDGYIAKKLDRTMVNGDFRSSYPAAHIELLQPGFSNHCASVTSFGISIKFTPGPFRFFSIFRSRGPLKMLGNTIGSMVAKLHIG